MWLCLDTLYLNTLAKFSEIPDSQSESWGYWVFVAWYKILIKNIKEL